MGMVPARSPAGNIDRGMAPRAVPAGALLNSYR